MSAFQDYAGAGTNIGGHYRWAGLTGQTTIMAAGASWFAFRWTDSVRYCRIRQVRVQALVSVVFTTAQVNDVALFKATGWTTAPTAAGTVTQPTGLMNQMADGGTVSSMTSLGGTLFSTIGNNIAIATTAGLTTGSPTVDANPLANDVFTWTGVTVGAMSSITLLDTLPGFDYPLTLATNEGFLLQNLTTQGAAGKVIFYVTVVFAVNNSPF